MLSSYSRQWLKFLLQMTMFVTSVWVILIFFVPLILKDDVNQDVVAYVLTRSDGQESLMLYDPHRGLSVPLLANSEFRDFSFNIDGRLAFSSAPEGNSEIYILDTMLIDSLPVNISQNPAASDYPLAWSRDGRFLAFGSYQDETHHRLYVWDGETAVDITPDNLPYRAASYRLDWSFDGRVAFVVRYGDTPQDEANRSDIYLWDGSTTTNLSQMPTGEDVVPTWNTNGRLAFATTNSGTYDIYVWDGVSFANGAPDKDTFVRVSSDAISYSPALTWTNDGRLVFQGQSPRDTNLQIYMWDGQTTTNLSQNPTMHNGGASWSNDGRWAFVTFFSPQQLV